MLYEVITTYYKEHFDPALKPVISVIDINPVVNDEMLKIITWLKENTFCTYFEALKTVIPRGLGVNFNEKYALSDEKPEVILNQDEKDFYDLITNETSEKKLNKILDVTINHENKILIEALFKKGFLKEDTEFKRNVGDETIRMVRLSEKYLQNQINPKITQKQNKVVEMLEECDCASIKELCYMCNVTPAVIKNLCKSELLETYEFEVLRSSYNFV